MRHRPTRRLPILAALAGGALLAAACSKSGPPPGAGPGPGDLTGTEWQLTRWEEGRGTPRPIPHGDTGQPLTLGFGARDGKPVMSGFSGCNRFTGGYEIEGDILTAGSLTSTKMACVTPQRNQLETDFLSLLNDGVIVQRPAGSQPERLRMLGDKGAMLIFNRRGQTAP